MFVRILHTAYTALLHRLMHKQATLHERWHRHFSATISRRDDAAPGKPVLLMHTGRARHC